MLKIMMIDSDRFYSAKIVENLLKINDVMVEFFPPKSYFKKTPIVDYKVQNTKKRWLRHLFPIQILNFARESKPDIIHIQFEFYGLPFYGGLSIMLFPILLGFLKIFNFKTVVTIHAIISETDVKKEPQLLNTKIPLRLVFFFLKTYTKLLSKLSSKILVQTKSMKDLLIKNYKISESNVEFLEQGVNTEVPEINKNIIEKWETKTEGTDVVLFFGLLSPRKGLELLFEAFSKIKNENIKLIIGGGESPNYPNYAEQLRKLAKKLGIFEKMIFTDYLDDAEIHALLDLSKITVFPFSIMPASSGTITWAMQHKKPIIATKTGYFVESFSDGDDIILFELDNAEQLAENLVKLVSDKELQEKLSKNIANTANQRSWENITKQYVEMYKKILK